MSRSIDWVKRYEIVAKLVEAFPSVVDSGSVTFNQVVQVISPCPPWIREKSISRGVYDISPYLKFEDNMVKKNVVKDTIVDTNVDTNVDTIVVENVVSLKSHMKSHTPEMDSSHFIPVVDPNYVPFGNYKDLDKIMSSGIFYPVYLTGPTGNGKSTSIEQICARRKLPLIRVNINMMSDEDQLIGTKTLEDGNIKIVEGPILQAMRMGCTILIDECLSEQEKIRVGTVDNWVAVPLSDFEIGVNYPVISFNMETGEYENDEGTIISEKEDDLYEVELDDGSIIVLNSKHPFIIYSVNGFVQTSINDGLQKGDMVAIMGKDGSSVKSIKKVGTGTVRNLTVFKNHTFITENGVVTHNCDAGNANTIMCIQSIMEGKPYYFKLKNEVITPKTGFNIIATANTKGKGSEDGRYIGTNILNEAFLERFAVTFEQDYPSAAVEAKIVANLMKEYDCVDLDFAGIIVKWSNAIRLTFNAGGVDENMTTRRVTHIVRAYSIFKNKKKAIELCCNRFDVNTKNAFMDLYEKISGDPDCNMEAIVENKDEDAISYEEVSF